MIEVRNLTKNYGKSRGIDDISFKIEEGEIVGFLGPNGAGKSTTMNIITGYLGANSGEAIIGGIDVLEDPIGAKKNIGYLPEQPPLYMDMTVDEYLDFVYELKGVTIPRSQHIEEICRLTGITTHRKRLIKNLSKGYKQRVGLAQAMIGNPSVLILDEPTVGLDPKQIIEIRNVIKKLGKDRTIILSTHILQEVSAVCERVIVINEGKIVADGQPDELAALQSGKNRMQVRIGAPKELAQKVLRSVDGIKSVDFVGEKEAGCSDFNIETEANVDIRKPVFYALAKANYPLLMIKSLNMTLEELFVVLTTNAAEKGGRVKK